MRKFLMPVLAAILVLLAGCGASEPAASSQTTAAPSPTVSGQAEASPSADADTENTKALLTLEIPALPDDTEVVDEVNAENGSSRKEWLYDGCVQVVSARVPCIEYDEDAVAAQIKSLAGTDPADFEAASDETLSQQLSYPVWRITYTTGANEDTREDVDVYIQTDSMDYWFHTATSADFFEDYEASIEDWINSLTLSE